MGKKFEGLHGLRGLAALLVLSFHLQAILKIELVSFAGTVVNHFYLCVMFFFVLSAFTLTYSNKASPTSLAGYAIKRFFRIAPLYYAVSAWMLLSRIGWPGWKELLANLTFTFNLIPGMEKSLLWGGWAVGVEVVFYVVLPVLIHVCTDWKNTAIAWMAALVASISLWSICLASPGLPGSYAYFLAGSNLVSFVAGIWVYRILEHMRTTSDGSGKLLLPLAALILLIYAFIDPCNIHPKSPGAYVASWGVAFATVCLWQAISPSALMRTRFMHWLGDRSYSIYLLHPILIALNKPFYSKLWNIFGTDGWASYSLSLAVTLPVLFCLAELTYRFIEKPGISLGRRLAALTKPQPTRPVFVEAVT